MPIHDWTRVEAGIFNAFHHGWVSEISRALNRGILAPQYYALPEQRAVGLGPDVLALEMRSAEDTSPGPATDIDHGDSPVALLVSPSQVRMTAESDMEYYRRKQSHIAVRHVTGDSLVAVVEVVSPHNKASRTGLQSFVEKVAEFLEWRIHLLILDLLPPTPRDPQGIHGAIWEEFSGREYEAPAGEPLTAVAYESSLDVRAYIEPLRIGGDLPSMPLYLEPGGYVLLPLERTYTEAFAAMPRRWRTVLEASA